MREFASLSARRKLKNQYVIFQTPMTQVSKVFLLLFLQKKKCLLIP